MASAATAKEQKSNKNSVHLKKKEKKRRKNGISFEKLNVDSVNADSEKEERKNESST